ncbi:P-loop containing nucleoside triphosphate hydrolase protein [Coprinopsis sp. MPI-PUGE-AT-0042]|nr:P-loop containing nucleoside triphosphate hydrolase protein [Coprinopsis sp. MPI-PUGE-AT-0042]
MNSLESEEEVDHKSNLGQTVDEQARLPLRNRSFVCIDNFDDMGLKPDLLRGIYAYGLERPSAIERQVIVPVIKGHDVVAQAQSSIDRTTVFPISVLQRVDVSVEGTQALILTPTRELAQPIQKVVNAIGAHMKIECHACVGGSKAREDMAKLQDGVHIVIGTPGRVWDMIRRRAFSTDSIQMLCLDEADEILSRGFDELVNEVFERLPRGTQVVILSPTIPSDLLEVAKNFMHDPVRVVVKSDKASYKGVKQFYIDVGKEERKFETLHDLFEISTIPQAVIFCNTKRKVDWLAEKMRDLQLSVTSMHADMDASQRALLMNGFRSGASRVLILTGLLARGIDVQQVSLIINYDLPTDRENYIHRIGRFDRKGAVINFATSEDISMLRDIEEFYTVGIDEMPLNVADFI